MEKPIPLFIMAKDKSGIEKGRRSRGVKIKKVAYGGPEKSGKSRGKSEIGKYDTSDWTTKNYVIAVIFLAIPYLGMLVALYLAGIKVLAALLLGITILVALLVSLAYWVDKINF